MLHHIRNALDKAKQSLKPTRKKRTRQPQEKMGVLALDIGTEWVKALVCEINYEEGKVHVKGVGKQRQRLGDMYNGGIIDINKVLENVQVAVEEAEMKANMRTYQTVIGIAGELVKGTTITVDYQRETPTEKMDLPELRNLVQKVQGKAFEKARKQISRDTGFDEVEIKLVHTSMVDVRIDGYRVSNPIGFKGKHVTMSIFNAFAPLVHFESIVEIADGLDKELLSVIVEPYAVAHASEMEDGGDVSSIFVDIGGGSTDVGIMVNGGIVGTRMFSIGGRVFTKRIAKHFHISFAEAEKLKLMFSQGDIKGKKEKEMKELITADVKTWLSGLHHTLSGLQKEEYLPRRMYLSGGGSMLPQIKEELTKSNWYKGLKFFRKPKVAYLKPEHITRVVDDTGNLKSQQDVTPMALANVAFELAGEERILTKVLKQVSRVVSK